MMYLRIDVGELRMPTREEVLIMKAAEDYQFRKLYRPDGSCQTFLGTLYFDLTTLNGPPLPLHTTMQLYKPRCLGIFAIPNSLTVLPDTPADKAFIHLNTWARYTIPVTGGDKLIEMGAPSEVIAKYARALDWKL